MKWINTTTGILDDGSIVNVYEDGYTELFPSKQWKRPKQQSKYGLTKCHAFQFHSKTMAIEVFNLVNANII